MQTWLKRVTHMSILAGAGLAILGVSVAHMTELAPASSFTSRDGVNDDAVFDEVIYNPIVFTGVISRAPKPSPTPVYQSHIPATQPFSNCVVREDVDWSLDGRIDLTWTYRFDFMSLLKQLTYRDRRAPESDVTWAYQYDEENRIVTLSTDNQADDTIDSWLEWEYDDSGRVSRLVAYDSEGAPTRRTTYTYDTPSRVTTVWIDLGADEVIDRKIQAEYDSLNQMIRQSRDSNADGEVDWVTEYEWRYQLLHGVTAKNAVDEVQVATTILHDTIGLPVLEEHDDGGDGSVDRVASRSYGADQQLIREVIDSHGRRESVTEYTYDSLGRPQTILVRRFGLGASTMVHTLDYECAK